MRTMAMTTMTIKKALFPASSRLLAGILLAATLGLAGCADKGRTPEEHIERAKDFLGQGKAKEAEIELRNALVRSPDNPQVHTLLAEISMSIGNYLMAETSLNKAREAGVSPQALRYPMARTLLMQGRAEEALKAAAPDTRDSQTNRLRLLDIQSRALAQLNRADESCARVADMQAMEPDNVLTVLGRARCAFLKSRDFATVASELQTALGKDPKNAEVWGALADLAWQQGKKPEAERAYLEAIKHDPFQQNARLGLVTLYLSEKRHDEALAQAETTRKINPTPFASYLIARVQLSKGDYQSALDHAANVLKVVPDHLPTMLVHGASALALGHLQLAETHLGRYVAQNPGNTYARQLLTATQLKTGAPDKALASLQPLLQGNGQDIRTLALAGEIYESKGDIKKAASYFQQVTQLDPKLAAYRAQHGALRLALGESGIGQSELEAASRLDPKDHKADAAMIAHHISSRNFDKAQAAIEQWLRKQPGNPMPHNLKGFLLVTRGDKAGARANFEKALALQPDFMPAVKNLAGLDVGEKNIAGAKKRFQGVLAKEPDNIEAMLELASLALRENNRAEQGQWLRKAADANPKAMEPRLRLVRHHLDGNNGEQALAVAREAVNAQPDNLSALELLARVQSTVGEHNNAASTLVRALALRPDSPDLHYQLAMVQGVLRQTDKARASLVKTLSLKPDHIPASTALALMEQDLGNGPRALEIARAMQRANTHGGLILEGDILMRQNKPREALAVYQKALGPRTEATLASRIHRAMLGAGDALAADARIMAWLRAHDGDLATRQYLALSHLRRKQYPQAAAQYEAMLRLQPDHVMHMNNLAWTYQLMGDPRALDLAEKAYRKAPESLTVLDTLGWVLVNRGDTRRGVEMLRKAASQPATTPGTRYRLAAGLAKAGDKAKAREILQPLLRDKTMFPERSEAQALLDKLG
jgi:putative PEP-CTERM system TPR-repeat lipoprotein